MSISSLAYKEVRPREKRKAIYIWIVGSEAFCYISLVSLKNQLIQQGRYTDCVDELIVKVTAARTKKLEFPEVLNMNGLYDKSVTPTDGIVKSFLGDMFPYYEELSSIAKNYLKQ